MNNMMPGKILNKFLQSYIKHATFNRKLHTSNCMFYFFEGDEKRGMKHIYDKPPTVPENLFKKSMQTLRILKQELIKFKGEMKESFMFCPRLIYRTDEVDIEHKFSPDPKCLDHWVVSCDKDFDLGNSTAKLELSPAGTGIFSGYLDTTVPKDGKTSYMGYANITTIPRTKSFFRIDPYKWAPYTHLIFRVRGDGRTYLINLSRKSEFDMTYFDLHSYFLYTRGGPYWQYTRIPFSKFFFASKGTVQDSQCPVPTHEVIKIGITIADKIKGPYKLEIDYIGVECDHTHREEHAYESYRFAKPML